MKKIFLILIFLTGVLFANETIFQSVIKNVALKDTQSAINSAKKLQKELNDENFTKFLKDWKRVEANYLAGEINSDYLDTPRYIDVFNNLKEDLNSQMKRVIESKDEVKIALFKNSFKTINALEYVLFNDKEISQREKELSIVILDSLITHLIDIQNVYKEYLNAKPKDEKWENALIINSLIASSYRLKEWRIGNASGNSSKFKNDAKNDRAEYFLSQNSFAAINAILDAHKQIILKNTYYDFATFVIDKGAAIELLVAVDKIEEMKKDLEILPKDDFSKADKLFKSASDLHNAYYISLLEQLSIVGKILDADGD